MKKRIALASFLTTVIIGAAIAYIFINIQPETPTYVELSPVNNNSTNSNDGLSTIKRNKPNDIDEKTQELRQSRIGKEITTELGYKAEIKKYKISASPNDPYSGQWWESYLDLINSVWDMPTPKKSTVIAIIDTGFALNHQEFNGRLFNNPGEVGIANSENPSNLNCTDQSLALDMSCNNVDDNVDGTIDNESGTTTYENPSIFNCTDQSRSIDKSCNLIDDDGNGYFDDVNGWDFVNSDPSPQAGELREANNVNTYHGTMVAGIAAANANNSVGMAGIDTNAKILPLQSIDDDGYGDSLTVASAIKYAADMSVDVINLSLGTDSPDIIMLQAIEYAYNKGVLVVASAGNDGCDCMVWPAKYDITISVGSLSNSGTRSSFSSYGQALDIVAPGSSITSTTYSSNNKTSGYATGSGTSFATPMISGLISVLKSQLPSASPLQLTALVTEQANKSVNGGTNKTNEYGFGSVSFTGSKNRSLNARTFEQLYKFGQVTNGGVFYGNKSEAPLYSCGSGTFGSTTVFKSTKSKFYYTVNPTDLRYASTNQYINKPEFNACVIMPHDVINSAKEINLAAETANADIKSLVEF